MPIDRKHATATPAVVGASRGTRWQIPFRTGLDARIGGRSGAGETIDTGVVEADINALFAFLPTMAANVMRSYRARSGQRCLQIDGVGIDFGYLCEAA